MDFPQFYAAVTWGAIVLVSALIGWSLKQVLELTKAVRGLEMSIEANQRENEDCAKDRAALHTTISSVSKDQASLVKDQAVLVERSFHHGKMLEEVKAILERKQPRARSAG